MTATHRKLIEVALPLDAINAASAREKSIRYSYLCSSYPWWVYDFSREWARQSVSSHCTEYRT